MDTKNIPQLEKHIKNAWIVGAISAIITFIYSLVGTYNDDVRYEYGFDTWSLLDVALIVGLTYGIYKKSRFSALAMLIYFVFSKFVMAASTGEFTGGFLSLVFAYFYFQGTKAAFQLHKHKLDNEAENERGRSRGIGFYFGVTLSVIILLVFGCLVVLGTMAPEVEVIPGKQVNKEYLNFVWEEGIVDRSEKIQYWYSDGFADFKDGFYLFTNEKVVVYSQVWYEPAILIPYLEISSIEFEPNLSFWEDSQITLLLNDESIVYIPVSSDNGGDIKFHTRLVEIWESSK